MNQPTNQTSKVRAINSGPSSTVAQSRYQLYRQCNAQIKHAMSQGFYLEAISLIESIIADRLESRIAHVNSQDDIYRKFGTIGELLFGRKSRRKGERILGLLSKEMAEPEELVIIYRMISDWGSRRNTCLHEMVKLDESNGRPWNARYTYAKVVATEGKKLSTLLSKSIRFRNKKT